VPVAYIPKYLPKVVELLAFDITSVSSERSDSISSDLHAYPVAKSTKAGYLWNINVDLQMNGEIQRISSRNH
jgi:hypothetical protein